VVVIQLARNRCSGLQSQVTDSLRLTLTDAQLHRLTEEVHRRENRTTVTVDRAALEALIIDHGRALRLLHHEVPFEKPRRQRL
jgi:hypothetical protein